ASLKGQVTDANGAPVMDAIISAALETSNRLPDPGSQSQAEMLQQNRQFPPHVLPVQAGTKVQFPNPAKPEPN
ncbi:MAG: hypothetical protein QF493_14330, partial [Rhodospirillales bacterium]|nr:hypothetical protein [Rhodospirillales bacterium]